MGVWLAYGACKRFVSRDAPVLASPAMRRQAVRGALLPVAAAALVFASFFFGDGSSQSQLFWIGTGAVVVAALGWGIRPPALPPAAVAFFAALTAFVLWQ